MRLFILAIFTFLLAGFTLSCKKEEATKSKDEGISIVENKETETSPKTLTIGAITIPENKIGMGCITEYYKAGTKQKEMLYMQTGAPDEIGWISFLNIDGKQIEFSTKNEDTYEDEKQNLIITKFENEEYKVIIEIKLGETHLESDSTEALGIIKVTDKKTNATGSAEFEGGTAC